MRWSRFDWLALLGLSLVTLVYFAPVIFYGQTFYFHDISIDYVPIMASDRQVMGQGELPLWNPYLNGGYPFAAESESSPLYLLNLILLLPLLLPTALSWYLVAHYILAGASTYLLVRRGLHLGPLPAFLAGLVFAFNGMMVAQLTNFTLVVTLAWLPLILFLYIRALDLGKISYAVGAGVVMAVQISKSHPQIVLYTAGLLAFYALFAAAINWRAGLGYRSLTPFAALALVFAVSAGLAAYQLLYTIELIGQSDRAGGLSYDKMTILSYPPFYLIKFLIPNFFGSFRHYAGNGNFPEMHAYVGILPLLLVPFAWLNPKGSAEAPRPQQWRVWFFAVLLLLCVVLSFGRFTPLYPLLQNLPLFSYFRVPARWLLLAAFCLAVLAAYGAQALIERKWVVPAVRPSWQRRLVLPIVIVLILGLLLWGGLATWRGLRHLPINYRAILAKGFDDPQLFTGYSWLMEDDPGERDYALIEPISTNSAAVEWQREQTAFTERVREAYKDMRQSLNLFGLMLFLALLLLAGRWWGWLNGPLFGSLATILILADMLTYGGVSLNPTTGAAYFLDPPDTVQFLRAAEPSEPYRIFPTITWIPNPENAGYVLSTLHYNFPALYGIESIEGGATLPLQRHTAYMRRAVGQAGGLQLLSLANVKYIVTEWDLGSSSDMELVFSGQRQKIYRNLKVLPRAFMVYRAEVMTDTGAILERLADPAFSPAEKMILEEQPTQPLPAAPPAMPPTVQMVSHRHNRVTLEVETAANGLLFLGDVFYPGWNAYLDGKAAPIYRADYLFRAVEVGPGRHTVEFRYEPLSFRIGVAISLVTLTALALAWALYTRKRLSPV